jgi:hypothetical protein
VRKDGLNLSSGTRSRDIAADESAIIDQNEIER